MQRLVWTITVLCGMAAHARADGVYVTESVGATNVKDELGAKVASRVRVRVSGGIRRGSFAVEGWVAGDLPAYSGSAQTTPSERCIDSCARPSTTTSSTALLTYGVDLKYLRPVTSHLELYLRGGLSEALEGNGYAGHGLGVGAGVQLKGKVPALGFLFWPLFFTGWGPKVTAAVFVDDGLDFYRLHEHGDLAHGAAIDAQLSHMTIGWAVGSDF